MIMHFYCMLKEQKKIYVYILMSDYLCVYMCIYTNGWLFMCIYANGSKILIIVYLFAWYLF